MLTSCKDKAIRKFKLVAKTISFWRVFTKNLKFEIRLMLYVTYFDITVTILKIKR